MHPALLVWIIVFAIWAVDVFLSFQFLKWLFG